MAATAARCNRRTSVDPHVLFQVLDFVQREVAIERQVDAEAVVAVAYSADTARLVDAQKQAEVPLEAPRAA
jgi:hypothetical protein